MLGLLYKEFIISKRSLIMSLIIYLFSIAVVCLTLCISLFAANGETPEDWAVSVALMNGILAVLLFGTMNCYYNNLFISDEKRAWANFSISLPTSVKGQVKAKYIWLFLINSVALFVAGIQDSIIGLVTDEFNGIGSFVGQIIFMFLILKYSLEIPFTLRFGTKTGNYIMTAGAAVLAFGLIIYGLFGDISFFMENDIMDIFIKIIEFIASDNTAAMIIGLSSWMIPILYIVSYKISCKVYKKEVESYEQ